MDWNRASNQRATRPRSIPPANSLEVIMGVRVSATSAENPTAAATVTPNSPNRRPSVPPM